MDLFGCSTWKETWLVSYICKNALGRVCRVFPSCCNFYYYVTTYPNFSKIFSPMNCRPKRSGRSYYLLTFSRKTQNMENVYVPLNNSSIFSLDCFDGNGWEPQSTVDFSASKRWKNKFLISVSDGRINSPVLINRKCTVIRLQHLRVDPQRQVLFSF